MSWLIAARSTRYLLDLYPSAAAAYSLRQLRTGVSNVVRVRRTSDNTEADFTAVQVSDGTLEAWVGPGNNGFVQTWYDQSGHSRHSSQAGQSSQPRIVNAGLIEKNLAKPCINFAVGSGLGIADRPLTGSVSPSVYILGFYPVASFADMIFVQSTGTITSFEIRMAPSGPLAHKTYEIINTSGTPLKGNADISNRSALLSVVFGINNLSAYVNGALDASATFSSLPSIRSEFSAIGARADGFPFRGKLQELIIYSDTAARSGVESSINSFYSIY